jgi:NADH-quinone oxidoreductase subunit F
MRIDCDTVIFAVGEGASSELAGAAGVKVKDSGLIDVDRYTLQTSREKIYAGGDVMSGPTNVSNAMGYGKKAARLIDEWLTGERRFSQIVPEFTCDDTPPSQPSESKRHVTGELPAEERATCFREVSIGLTPVEAMEESCRCLRCDIRDHEH